MELGFWLVDGFELGLFDGSELGFLLVDGLELGLEVGLELGFLLKLGLMLGLLEGLAFTKMLQFEVQYVNKMINAHTKGAGVGDVLRFVDSRLELCFNAIIVKP